MSLIKQLWIAIAAVVMLMYGSSFGLSFLAAKDYFEEQLRLKNIDNATSLALTLGQIEKDPALIETFISAQFDLGHYLRIRLDAPNGELLAMRESDVQADEVVPRWFVRLFALDVPAGLALVPDGWTTFGQLTVESHHSYAYQALWRSAWRLAAWSLLLALFCAAIGSILLKRIIRPLDTVIEQAEAIGEQRFLTAGEPRTREFGQLVRAMNRLSARVREILEEEGSRLKQLRFSLEHDSLTGLFNRESFLGQVDALLAEPDAHYRHGFFIVRLLGLAELNQRLGRETCDVYLASVAETLREAQAEAAEKCRSTTLGRPRPGDFVLLAADSVNLQDIADLLQERVRDLAAEGLELAVAGCVFHSGELRAEVLQRADTLLARAEVNAGGAIAVCFDETPLDVPFHTSEEWRSNLLEGLADGVVAELFPVVGSEGELLHEEAMMRMRLAGQVCTAGFFVPWARRLGMQGELDLALLEHILKMLAGGDARREVAVNLSPEIFRDALMLARLEELLRTYSVQARQLWLECNEKAALQNPESFELFARRVRQFGCRLGVDRAAGDILHLPRAHELGLGYLKIDAVYAQRLAGSDDVANFLQRLGVLARSLGIRLILEGVATEELAGLAQQCGMDGLTGPAVRIS